MERARRRSRTAGVPADNGQPAPWLARAERWAVEAVHRMDRVPLAADAALVFVLAIATLPQVIGHGATPTALALHVALWLPVVFRRRAPSVVFGLVVCVAFLQWLAGIELAADLALLVALYTVAAHRKRSEAVVAAAVLEVGVVLASLSWGHEDGLIRTFVQLSGVVVAALLLGTTVQSRTLGFALLRERADRLERERDQQALIAAAAERTRIAREMHDIVAHSLSVMITLADGASLTDRPDEAHAAMRQVSRTGRDALADTRRVLDVLRDDRSAATRQPAPTITTLTSLLTAVRATGLTVDLVSSGTDFEPTPAAQTAVYRIVQEALTNTVKHAAATRVHISLLYRTPAVEIEIVDNGTSGSSHAPGSGGGHGLVGMRERAALFGGTVHAGPDPAGGWRVAATLPRTTGPSS